MNLVPHSLILLRPVSVWRTSVLHHPEHLCQGRRPGSWHWGQRRDSKPMPARARLSDDSVFTCHLLGVSEITARDCEHLGDFLFRLLKMERTKRRERVVKQSKKAWEGRSRREQLCIWQAKQHDPVSFKIVFSLNSEWALSVSGTSQDLVSCKRVTYWEAGYSLDSSLGFNFWIMLMS